jgi:hypothetical protein
MPETTNPGLDLLGALSRLRGLPQVVEANHQISAAQAAEKFLIKRTDQKVRVQE